MTFEEELKQEKNHAIIKIGKYLEERSKEDSSVANDLKKEIKSLGECWKYILGEAKKQAENNCACIDDDTVFGWAVHYYDEDDIKIKSANITKVVSGEQKQPKVVKTQPSDTPKPIKKEKVTNTRKKKTDPVEGQISLF